MALASKKLEEVIHYIAFMEVRKGDPLVFDSHALAAKLVSLGTKIWIDTGDLDLAKSIWKREFTRYWMWSWILSQYCKRTRLELSRHGDST